MAGGRVCFSLNFCARSVRSSSSLNHASSSTLSSYLPPSRPCDSSSSPPLSVLALLKSANLSSGLSDRPLARPSSAVDSSSRLDSRLVIVQQTTFGRYISRTTHTPQAPLAAAFPFWLPPSWRALAFPCSPASLLRAPKFGSAEATRSHHNWSTAYLPHHLLIQQPINSISALANTG
jgi:hypothetical protein